MKFFKIEKIKFMLVTKMKESFEASRIAAKQQRQAMMALQLNNKDEQ